MLNRFALCAAMFTAAAWAQATYDSSAIGVSPNRLRYPLTVSAGANRALAVFVHVSGKCGTPDPTVATVTYAGVPLTQVLVRKPTGCSGATSELWALPAGTQPSTGTSDVVITLSGPTASHRTIHSGAFFATGVDQSTTFTSVAANSGNSASATASLPSSGANDLVIDSACDGTGVGTTPQTSQWVDNIVTEFSCANSGGATASGGTTSLSWNVSSDIWLLLAASFKAAPAQTAALGGIAHSEGGDQLTYSLTVGSAANRGLAVFTHVATPCGIAEPSVTGVTYAGASLTQLGNFNSALCLGGSSAVWALPAGVEPASGPNPVVVNLGATMSGVGTLNSGAISAFSVDQAQPFTGVSASEGNSASPFVSIVSTGPEDLVTGSVCTGHSVDAAFQTERWRANLSTYNSCDNFSGVTADGGTPVLSWTVTSDFWIALAGAFNGVPQAPSDGGGDGGTGTPGDAGANADAGPLGPLTVGCACRASPAAQGAASIGIILMAVILLRPRARPRA